MCLSVSILALQATTQLMSDSYQQLQYNKRSKIKQAILLKRRRSRSNCQGRCSTPSPSISSVSMRTRGLVPPCCSRPDPACLWPSFTCLLPLAAQRNGGKRMCSPVYLLMLPVCEKLALFTGIHRVGPCPIE